MVRFYLCDQLLHVKVVINLVQTTFEVSSLSLVFVDDADVLEHSDWAQTCVLQDIFRR